MRDAFIAAASLVSFGSDGLNTSFAQNAVGRDFSPNSCKTVIECDSGWISFKAGLYDRLRNDPIECVPNTAASVRELHHPREPARAFRAAPER
jgi:hypothetical protein